MNIIFLFSHVFNISFKFYIVFITFNIENGKLKKLFAKIVHNCGRGEGWGTNNHRGFKNHPIDLLVQIKELVTP